MPFALAGLLCVSSAWATDEHGSRAKDDAEAELTPIKKPLAGTRVPVRSAGTEIAQASAETAEKNHSGRRRLYIGRIRRHIPRHGRRCDDHRYNDQCRAYESGDDS